MCSKIKNRRSLYENKIRKKKNQQAVRNEEGYGFVMRGGNYYILYRVRKKHGLFKLDRCR